MSDALGDHAPWLIAAGFGAAFVGVSLAGVLFVAPAMRRLLQGRGNEVVDLANASFTLSFGILLGLLAVGAYHTESDLEEHVNREAAALAVVFRNAGGYPEPLREAVRNALRRYVAAVIDEDWPSMRRGEVPLASTLRFEGVARPVLSYAPETLAQATVHGDMLAQLARLVEMRQLRLGGVDSGVPGVIWWVVGIGSGLAILLLWMVDLARAPHLVLTGVIAFYLSAVIFLIAVLDNPYHPWSGVTPEPFLRLQALDRALGPR